MDTYKQLRKDAAAKRDNAIRAAKLEFNETVQKIAELETRLKGERRPRRNSKSSKPSLADLIYSVLPEDRTFTLDDVIGVVKSVDPERTFSKQTIYTNLNRFLKSGAIKRISHAGHKSAAVFAMPDLDVQAVETMADWAFAVLNAKQRPMTTIEIAVAMTEQGYLSDAKPSDIVRSLGRELKKFPDRFAIHNARVSLT